MEAKSKHPSLLWEAEQLRKAFQREKPGPTSKTRHKLVQYTKQEVIVVEHKTSFTESQRRNNESRKNKNFIHETKNTKDF